MKNKNITFNIADFKSSIAAKVILIVSITIILSIFTLGFAVNKYISDKITALIEERNLEIARMVEKDLDSFLKGAKASLLFMSQNYGLRSNNKVRIVAKSMFLQELESSPYFQSLFFVAADDDQIIEPEPELSDKYNPQNEDWYREAVEKNAPVWTFGQKEISNNNYTLTVSVPVYDYSKKFMGVLGADISTAYLNEIINWKIGEKGYITLVNKEGKVIALSSTDDMGVGTNIAEQLAVFNLLNEESGTGIYSDGEKEHLVSAVALKEIGGAILTQVPVEEAYATREGVTKLIITYGLVILILMIVIIIFALEYYLIRPLLVISASMEKVAQGNLKTRIRLKRSDEIGKLTYTFNLMVKQLEGIIGKIDNAAEKITLSSQHIKEIFKKIIQVSGKINIAISSVSAGNDEMAGNIEKANHEIQDLATSLLQLSETNNRVDNLTGKMNAVTEKGQQEVGKMKRQMANIRLAIQDVAVVVKSLENSSNEIDKILQLIDSIAEQTNLLALNATIEAARAGAAGRGFSVVAEKIRELAEESSNSADKIKKIIHEIKGETKTANERMVQSKREIESGEEVVTSTASSFEDIRNTIKDLTEGISLSHRVVNESTQNSEKIVSNMENIAQIAKDNSTSAQEVAAVIKEHSNSILQINTLADNLTEMAAELEKMVKQFNLNYNKSLA